MKPLFDIFSKSKTSMKKDSAKQEKQKIIIDYREKNSLVASALIEMGFCVQFRELKVADYLVNNIAIERKTISDFINSLINKRIIKQIEELKQYENRLMIIEGVEEQELYHDDAEEDRLIHPNAIRGFLLSATIKHKIPVILTKNYDDTAKYLAVLARKKERESSLNVKRKSLNRKERLQFILEGFPGIGPKTARKLLEKFGTIKKIANASLEELAEIIGKKADVFRLLEEQY
jgi:Fanconi anemia group M protein